MAELNRVLVAVWAGDAPERFAPALRELRRSGHDVVVGTATATATATATGTATETAAGTPTRTATAAGTATGSAAIGIAAGTGGAFLNGLDACGFDHLVVVSAPVAIPAGALDEALSILRADPRVATVSFLSNAAGFLSVPARNQAQAPAPNAATERLRHGDPHTSAVAIPWAAGPVVVVAVSALAAGSPFQARPSLAGALADFSCRLRERGFVDVLAPSTYVSVEAPLPDHRFGLGLPSGDLRWLAARHPMAVALATSEATERDSALGLALAGARARVAGLSVVVDGTCITAREMGTQVATVAIVDALARRNDVTNVRLLVDGPLPAYAEHLHKLEKLSTTTVAEAERNLVRGDVFHRPFQPNEGFDIGYCRRFADRVVVTVYDLISFTIGNYSGEPGVWLAYRSLLRRSLAAADAVVVPSEDVRRQFSLHRLPSERVVVVAIGTDHPDADDEPSQPGGVAGERPFLLCLGTDYTHKNRDLAVATLAELRRRGVDVALVVTGPAMDWGTTGPAERRAAAGLPVSFLGELAGPERNWLLREAAAVLYPTAAEGFGLVPFEAARFGTPTVHVRFGPLAELVPDAPVTAPAWTATALADAAGALLADDALSARQVAAYRDAGRALTWDGAAAALTDVYRQALGRPPSCAPRAP